MSSPKSKPAKSKLNRIDDLTDIELERTEAVRYFCDEVGSLCNELALYMQWHADQLQANLSTLPDPEGNFGTYVTRTRAKAVTWYMRCAAEAIDHAGGLVRKCFVVFHRYYIHRQEYRPRNPPKFNL